MNNSRPIATIAPRNYGLALLCSIFCVFLLIFRIYYTQTPYYKFLVWNLFLAVVPYLLTMGLLRFKVKHKGLLGLGFLMWLAFLPNAPYMVTDLYHLKGSSYSFIWLDTLMLLSFALCGLYLFYSSLLDMRQILLQFIHKRLLKTLSLLLFLLVGFGIYLGRFLRYNSWEILSDPRPIFSNIWEILSHPQTHEKAWYFSISFGVFLACGNWIFNSRPIAVHL